jgi:hypothetical protein
MVGKRCWFKACLKQGEPRPIFAHAHALPASLRLCDRHLSELAQDPDNATTSIERPERT